MIARCKLNQALIFLVGSLGMCESSLGDEVTLCSELEDVYFSCPLSNGKMVSICASKNSSPSVGYVQYRYGSRKIVELYYPSVKKAPMNLIFYVNASEGSSSLDIIKFRNRGYTYKVYQAFVSGLTVLRHGRVVKRENCEPSKYAFISDKAERGLQSLEIKDEDLQ